MHYEGVIRMCEMQDVCIGQMKLKAILSLTNAALDGHIQLVTDSAQADPANKRWDVGSNLLRLIQVYACEGLGKLAPNEKELKGVSYYGS